jgi:hypothetical protein
MATLDWTCETVDGVTLVELVVTSSKAQRVCIESNLTPVWPPRRQGQPAAGWNGPTFEGELDSDGRLVVGYASPAAAVEPPAELTTESPAEADEIDPRDVIQALGDGTPPRDAVPTEQPSPPSDSGTAAFSANDERSRVPEGTTEPNEQSTQAGRDLSESLPPAVAAYFDGVDRRLAAAEELADPGSVEQAQEAVSAAGGLAAVDGLDRQLDADRKRLKRLDRRQQALAGRLDSIEIPVERLERVT